MFEKTFKAAELSWEGGLRKACRWVIIDENGKIPLLFVSKKKYHKIPWWWMEWDEDKITSFMREIEEETGCKIDDIVEVWKVTEKNSKWEQISYCFVWRIITKWEKHFTQKEIERGFQLIWVKFEDALWLIENEEPRTEAGLIMKERESYILWEIIKLKK